MTDTRPGATATPFRIIGVVGPYTAVEWGSGRVAYVRNAEAARQIALTVNTLSASLREIANALEECRPILPRMEKALKRARAALAAAESEQ